MTGPGERLVLDRVTKQFQGQDGETLSILHEVSCEVQPAETVAIVGPSGSGKSTLLNLIGGLDRPDGGTITLGDENVGQLEGKALAAFRATRVGFVFQDHHLLPQLTALENVLMPTLALDGTGDANERAEELLERVGLTGRRDAFPSQMSGGERQRVALARALINGAQLLLCDEPTGNLDRQTGANVISLLAELAAGHGVTVLMVTHNVAHAARLARCLELVDGTLTPLDVSAEAGGDP